MIFRPHSTTVMENECQQFGSYRKFLLNTNFIIFIYSILTVQLFSSPEVSSAAIEGYTCPYDIELNQESDPNLTGDEFLSTNPLEPKAPPRCALYSRLKLYSSHVLPCEAKQVIALNDKFIIQSPGFRSNSTYPNSITCTWELERKDCTMLFDCKHFDLHEFLCFDNMEVIDSGGVRRFCGSKGPVHLSLLNNAIITFQSSPFFSSSGFKCELTCLEEDVDNSAPLESPTAEKTNCSCGVYPDGSKIVGGREANPGEFPWQAWVACAGLVRKNGNIPFCGGSLINDKYILTASHCVTGRTPYNLEVILNEHNTRIGCENSPPIRRPVELIIPHKSYNRKLDYDVALIKMTEPVNLLKEPVLPICLPDDAHKINTFEGVNGTISGWGLTEEDGNLSPVLKKAFVSVISNKNCSHSYPGRITDRMLCAYTPDTDACQGDSGGPLMFEYQPDLKKYVQIGIVSWGRGCARPDNPGVYTRVTEILNWIAHTTKDGSYCAS